MKNKLDHFKQQKAFQAPEGYFEDFAQRMQNEVSPVAEQNTWLSRLEAVISMRLLIPGMTVIILCIVGLQLQDQLVFNEEYTFNDTDIQSYIVEEAETDDLFEWALEENFISAPVVLEEDILDYLLEDEIELDLLETYL